MGTKYSTVTIAGYNSSPPADDGSQTDSNKVKWSTIKQKLPDPLKTAIESINSQLVTALDVGSRQISSADSTVAADHMKTVEIGPTVSASITVSLGDAATMAAGYVVTVKNSSSNSQTIGRATAGDKVDGLAQNITIPSKCSLTFMVANTASEGYLITGQSGGFVIDKNDLRKTLVWSASNVSSGVTRNGNVPNYDFFVQSANIGTDVASAATLDLDSATGDLVEVSGTTAVSAITLAAGKMATVRFLAALILNHSGTLQLPGNTAITTAAGDFAIFRGYGSGVVRCIAYTKDDGTPVINANGTTITIATEQAPTSSTVASVDFTGIPSWVKKITIMGEGISTNGTSLPIIQLGDGAIETSGYIGSCNATTFTTGFGVLSTIGSVTVFEFLMTLFLKDAANNTWTSSLTASRGAGSDMGSGNKSLSTTLDRIRLTTVGGTDTFDAGSINIQYE